MASGSARASRHYILMVLMLIYVLNYLDRQIVSILQVQIKQEFALADWQLGLMTGVAFSIFYSVFSLPIARITDTSVRRVTVISIALAFWSGMTALCGAAQNFIQLLLARAGVGLGEAGWAPPAVSLVADLYPGHERARAMGFLSAGIPIGAMIGLGLGGLIAEHMGWRTAMLAVGAPGIVLSMAVARWMPEPLRQFTDASGAKVAPFTLRQTFADMWAKPSYRHLLYALTLASFLSSGLMVWFPLYFSRTHGLSLSQIGLWWGAAVGASGLIGMIGGGWVADYVGAKRKRNMLRAPALVFVAAAPLHLAAIMTSNSVLCIILLVPTLIAGALWMAPNLAVTQFLAPPQARSMVSAISLLAGNLLGVAMGPFLVGVASDAIGAHLGGETVGLKWALALSGLAYIWAAIHFWLSSNTLDADIEIVQRK